MLVCSMWVCTCVYVVVWVRVGVPLLLCERVRLVVAVPIIVVCPLYRAFFISVKQHSHPSYPFSGP